LFYEASQHLNRKREGDRYVLWQSVLNDTKEYTVVCKSKPKTLNFRGIKLYNNINGQIDRFYSGRKNRNKYKTFKISSATLDETKSKKYTSVVDTNNLLQEHLSQTKELLSKTVKIEAIMKELNILSVQQQCAAAALLSTNLSFKLDEEILKAVDVKDATFDVDNVTSKFIIVKLQVFDEFNKRPNASLQLSSLLLTNTLGVKSVLSYFMSLFRDGLCSDNCFNDTIANKCLILGINLISNPRPSTHIKTPNFLKMTEIPSANIFNSNPCRVLVGYDGGQHGKTMQLFIFFFEDFILFIFKIFVQLF
jgi:hypothetical protein